MQAVLQAPAASSKPLPQEVQFDWEKEQVVQLLVQGRQTPFILVWPSSHLLQGSLQLWQFLRQPGEQVLFWWM